MAEGPARAVFTRAEAPDRPSARGHRSHVRHGPRNRSTTRSPASARRRRRRSHEPDRNPHGREQPPLLARYGTRTTRAAGREGVRFGTKRPGHLATAYRLRTRNTGADPTSGVPCPKSRFAYEPGQCAPARLEGPPARPGQSSQAVTSTDGPPLGSESSGSGTTGCGNRRRRSWPKAKTLADERE